MATHTVSSLDSRARENPNLNVKNRTLFHGDNLKFLQGINTGCIDLIYADPPFNKNRDFYSDPESLAGGGGFEDRWRWDEDVHDDWVESIRNDRPGVHSVIEAAKVASGMGMAAFLCWLGVRLMECHRVLSPEGTMYLHIDDTAHAWVKCIMDDVFGSRNFRNEVVWKRATSKKADSGTYGRVHDTLLFYTKSDVFTWNQVHLDYDETYIATHYRHDDGDGRGVYRVSDMTQSGWTRGESGMTWRGVSMQERGKHWITPTGKGLGDWIVANVIPNFREIEGTLARLDALDEHGLVYWPPNGGMPGLKRYYAAMKHTGPAVTDLFDDIPPIQDKSPESVGYPTQKPLRLLRRIIESSSNLEDTVLDPFCGCATAPIAAEHLGRRWIGMDTWDKAHETVLNRLAAEGLAVPDGEYKGQADLIPFGEVVRTTDVPVRTDDMKVAVADFELERQVPLERWEKLKTRDMRGILASAQAGAQEMVVCAGCGRQLEPEFMELDHNHPKSLGGENVITNRLLLCRPCNGYKGNKDTVAGLWSTNKQSGWMKDGSLAEIIYHGAVRETQNVKKRLRGTS